MTRHALNTSPPTHFFSNVQKEGIKVVFSSIKKTLANIWFQIHEETFPWDRKH